MSTTSKATSSLWRNAPANLMSRRAGSRRVPVFAGAAGFVAAWAAATAVLKAPFRVVIDGLFLLVSLVAVAEPSRARADLHAAAVVAGRRTHANATSPPEPVLNRRVLRWYCSAMIAINTAGQPQTDYAIMKQVQQLRRAHPYSVVMLTSAADFSGMAEDERLFIVSHGDATTGNLRDLSVDTLLKYLNDARRGVPTHFGGITILSCYSGQALQNQSLAQRVATGLKVRGKTVEGALGFSFGSPEFLATGRSSVLDSALRPFYEANDITAMVNMWAQHHPTHTNGVLVDEDLMDTDKLHTASPKLIIRDNLRKMTADDATARMTTLIRHFKSEAKRIELSLGQLLAQIPGTTVDEKITSFEERSGSDARTAARWNRVIDQQYALFSDYYLWLPSGNAFASFTS